MGRRRKGEPKVEKEVTSVVVTFREGPRGGQEMKVSNPPPLYMKLAMPEWAVYRWTEGEYRLLLSGDAARYWRNPVRSEFF